MLLVTAAGCVANALEAAAFPAAAALSGLRGALALAAALTLAYAGAAHCLVPETRRRTPQQVYAALCPPRSDKHTHRRPLTCFDVFNLKGATDSSNIEKGNGDVISDIVSKGTQVNKEDDTNIKNVKEAATAECVVSVPAGDGQADSTDL